MDSTTFEELEGKWLSLPDSILLEIFCFLSADWLVRCNYVCQSWLRVSNSDKCWKTNYVSLRKGSGILSSSCELYPYIRLERRTVNVLSVKELKSLLRQRGENYSSFTDKKCFQSAVIDSTVPHVRGLTHRFSNKWKASYVYALRDTFRNSITRHELIANRWQMRHPDDDHVIGCLTFELGKYCLTTKSEELGNEEHVWSLKRNREASSEIRLRFTVLRSQRLSPWHWRLTTQCYFPSLSWNPEFEFRNET
mmetsp:Transcript_12483/g.14346  ORF Transcript_12483/g.14346 Transcript_12483/m.14346 type:complete len:251 (+) Transcript_12483:213-965(+)